MTKDDILREFHAINYFYNDCCKYDTLSQMLDELIDKCQEYGRWIPVSERLPEEQGSYITTLDYGEYGLSVGQRYYHGKDYGWGDLCAIAWMPLPAPYKAESEVQDADSN